MRGGKCLTKDDCFYWEGGERLLLDFTNTWGTGKRSLSSFYRKKGEEGIKQVGPGWDSVEGICLIGRVVRASIGSLLFLSTNLEAGG